MPGRPRGLTLRRRRRRGRQRRTARRTPAPRRRRCCVFFFFLFFFAFDLNSGDRGCARLGGEVASTLGMVKEEVAVLVVLVRRNCCAAAVRRAVGDEVPGAVEGLMGQAAVYFSLRVFSMLWRSSSGNLQMIETQKNASALWKTRSRLFFALLVMARTSLSASLRDPEQASWKRAFSERPGRPAGLVRKIHTSVLSAFNLLSTAHALHTPMTRAQRAQSKHSGPGPGTHSGFYLRAGSRLVERAGDSRKAHSSKSVHLRTSTQRHTRPETRDPRNSPARCPTSTSRERRQGPLRPMECSR